MKSFNFISLPLVVFALGGVLTLAPGARAQSDVAPDHFDGTDSWAAGALAKAPAAKPSQHAAMAKQQAGRSRSATPAVQPVAAREVTTSQKRKAPARKTTNPTN